MLTIRLYRTGKKGQPFYKIVVTDKRNAAHRGRFVEEVGVVNPIKKDKAFKAERIKYWLKMGAKPSVTVFNMLLAEKIIEGDKIANHAKSKKKEEAKPTVTSAPVSTPVVKETPVAEAKPEVKAEPVVEVKVEPVAEPEKVVAEAAPEVKVEPVVNEVKLEEASVVETEPVKEAPAVETIPEDLKEEA